MSKLYFWNDWDSPFKKIYWVVFIGFIATILYCLYQYFFGINAVIHWEIISKLEQLKTTAHSINIGTYQYSFPLDNYVVTQYFRGSDLNINPLFGYLFLATIVIATNLLMSLVSFISKVWFYISMAVFCGFIVLLNLDQIMLFGNPDKTALAIILGTYLPASYYFKEISPRVSILWRFLVFNIISVLIGGVFYQFSAVENPFLYIANHGIYGPLAISILYIIFVSHEIIFGFLYLITNSNTSRSKNSLLHFVVISSLFLLYVTLTYLKYTNNIEWDLIYLNPYILGLITIILGIWGYRRREHLYSDIFRFKEVGPLLYLGFGIITMATIAYFFSVYNDPFMEIIEDAVLYSQVGFGIMFFMYVIINFSPLLGQNMQVSKIVYQSRGLPFFSFRLGGILAVGFMLFDGGFFPYYQSIAGYYNSVGDLHLVEKNYELAKEYYNEGAVYEFQNHRSNYGLATIARKQKDIVNEAYYFENSMLKQPSEFAYVNMSNVYLNNNQYFESLFKLKEGEKAFPKSSHILNNLGYLYSKTDITDSAYYYYDLAYLNKDNNEVSGSNIFSLLAKAGINISLDSLENIYMTDKNIGGRANKLAMHNQFKLGDYNIDDSWDTSLNEYSVESFAYLYNLGLSRLKSADTLFFTKLVTYADSSRNEFFINRSKILKALNLYFTHQVTNSFFLLFQLGDVSMFNDEYFNILGQLAMELNSPELAVDYFRRTSFKIIDGYAMNLAVAELETGNLDTAKMMFQRLESSENRYISKQSLEYKEVLYWMPEIDNARYSDEFSYLLLRYRNDLIVPEMKSEMILSIENYDIKTRAILDQVERSLEILDFELAEEYFQLLNGEEEEEDLKIASQMQKIKFLFVLNGIKEKKFLSEIEKLPLNDPNYLYDFLMGLNYKESVIDTVFMDEKFNTLSNWNMFFEKGVISAADYYYNQRNMENYAYNLLVNALNINPYSYELNDYYIEFCIETGLLGNASDRLNTMKGIFDELDFETYFIEKGKKIRDKEVEMEIWWQ